MRKLTTEEFIEKARIKHGDKYDYSKSEYKGGVINIEIICKKHGSFFQRPANHLFSQGCKKCGVEKRTLEQVMPIHKFISKAKSIHGNRYCYDLVEFSSVKNKVKIICKEHGEFTQTVDSHLNKKRGCSKCNGGTGYDSLSFIEVARSVHGDKYTYDNVVYINQNNKVVITCKIHGDFLQAPSSHLQGVGCRKCASYGYNTGRLGYLYVLRSNCGKYLKIGISHSHRHRLRKLLRDTPFEFSLYFLIRANGDLIANMESKFHKVFDSAGFKGFDGATEWFHYDSEKLEQLKNYGESINEN